LNVWADQTLYLNEFNCHINLKSEHGVTFQPYSTSYHQPSTMNFQPKHLSALPPFLNFSFKLLFSHTKVSLVLSTSWFCRLSSCSLVSPHQNLYMEAKLTFWKSKPCVIISVPFFWDTVKARNIYDILIYAFFLKWQEKSMWIFIKFVKYIWCSDLKYSSISCTNLTAGKPLGCLREISNSSP
jgi:hypothetical protein